MENGKQWHEARVVVPKRFGPELVAGLFPEMLELPPHFLRAPVQLFSYSVLVDIPTWGRASSRTCMHLA